MHVSLITNPADDDQFRAAAEELLLRGAETAARLQERLRDTYPSASVVEGIRDQAGERWYVYRDGHWIRSSED
jgi:hypothetical protein